MAMKPLLPLPLPDLLLLVLVLSLQLYNYRNSNLACDGRVPPNFFGWAHKLRKGRGGTGTQEGRAEERKQMAWEESMAANSDFGSENPLKSPLLNR